MFERISIRHLYTTLTYDRTTWEPTIQMRHFVYIEWIVQVHDAGHDADADGK